MVDSRATIGSWFFKAVRTAEDITSRDFMVSKFDHFSGFFSRNLLTRMVSFLDSFRMSQKSVTKERILRTSVVDPGLL